MASLVKIKLLEIHNLALFTRFTPSETLDTYAELNKFLSLNVNTLNDVEYYNLLELGFYLSLIQSKDIEARTLLDRIIDKFGDDQSEKITNLKTDYLIAIGESNNTISKYLDGKNPNELITLKKKLQLSKNESNVSEYIKNLHRFLELNPLDVETLSELKDVYIEVGHYDKAIFVLQELLTIQPFNFVIYYRIGELYNLKYERDSNVIDLISSFQNFARSVELSSNYVKSWLGIHITSTKISKLDSKQLNKVSKLPKYEKFIQISHDKLNELIKESNGNLKDLKLVENYLSTLS